MKGFSPKRSALKVEVLEDRKIFCWQARPCIFQPGHLTGWDSEGVKRTGTELCGTRSATNAVHASCLAAHCACVTDTQLDRCFRKLNGKFRKLNGTNHS